MHIGQDRMSGLNIERLLFSSRRDITFREVRVGIDSPLSQHVTESARSDLNPAVASLPDGQYRHFATFPVDYRSRDPVA